MTWTGGTGRMGGSPMFDATDAEAVELIRVVLSRGSYQMPHERLPYSAQAHAVWEAVGPHLAAERDRLRESLTFVLGEFDQDRSQCTGAVLDLWSGCLTGDELAKAREALSGDGTDG